MHPDIRRAALRATARIALGVTVTGCQAATVSTTQGAGDGSVDAADVATRCDPTVPTGASVACCTAQLTASLGDAGAAVTAPADLACCRYLIAQNDRAFADGGTSQVIPYRTQCCTAVGTPQGFTCTPWGPPVPPAMADERVA